MAGTSTPLAILKTRFGYDSFRGLQEEIITNILAQRHSLVLIPTGGGKSICYQLPALIFDGITLVISPLIALMKDQVDALNANGIAARFINSSLPASEIEQVQTQVRRGQVKLLYVAPERLALPGFNRFLHSLTLSLIAIDEAHCISEWGHQFRPDYRNLRQLRQEFPDVPVTALTATATEQVREDIISQLDLQQGQVFLSSFDRGNLSYSVQPKDNNSWRSLLSLLRQHQGQSTIIYCFTQRETANLAKDLSAAGLSALAYHAGLDPGVRRRTQDDFIRDRVPIIVATIAFGMGIDKPDIRLVAHYSLPKSLEGYYQETGRAGRDGLPSSCVLFYNYSDKVKQDYFINQIEDATEQQNARQKMAQMVKFAQLTTCRRRFIMEYFGERWEEENCKGCDICLGPREQFDATEVALKILSAVIRTGERFGANHIVQVLTGSREKRILELGHDQLSVHGISKDFGGPQLREVIEQLHSKGLLERGKGDYPTVVVSPRGREFLQKPEALTLPRPQEGGASVAKLSRAGDPAATMAFDEDLFAELRTLRSGMAEAQGVPNYVVFGDATLKHMAADFPLSPQEFLRIPGVGQVKLERYGLEFLEAIRSYAEAGGLTAAAAATQMRRQIKEKGVRQELDQPRPSRGATTDATKELLSQKLSISQIAEKRGFTETTVVGHMEKIVRQGVVLDLDHLLPPPERFGKIREAFDVCGIEYLKPVWEFLGTDFTYDELRLARMQIWQEEPAADRKQL